MIRFKNHNSGFAFIEIMIAIALLAVFGTNLFMTQGQLFANVARTHYTVIKTLLTSIIAPDFLLKLADTKKAKKPTDTIIIDKDIQYPSAHCHLEIKKIPEKSALFEDFHNYLQLVEQTVIYNDKKSRFVTFLFNPPPPKENEATKTVAKGAR